MLSATDPDEPHSKSSSFLRNRMRKNEGKSDFNFVEEIGDRVEAINGKLVTTQKKSRPEFQLNLEELGINP